MKLTSFILTAAAAALFASCDSNNTAEPAAITGYTDKEAIENIFERKSVRNFTDQTVEREKIELIVRAGMAAPSGMDRRPWEIIVIEEQESMDKLAGALPYAKMLTESPMAIVVCGDQERSSYWYIDCSAVTQNILLAAEALGLGAVWTGAYPDPGRMEVIAETLGLPENVLPLCVIPMGYPDGEQTPKDKWDESKLHWNKW